ncbi:MAG: hypothetical protein NVS3B10_22880 [Polyangiales bacterium]
MSSGSRPCSRPARLRVLIVISRTQIVSPRRRLSDAARRVGGGDLATRVDVRSTDELGQLANAFNRMSEEIGDRERRLAAATQNLRDLFDHMGHAIVAFDAEGKVRGAVSRLATKLFDAVGLDEQGGLDGRPIRALLFGDKAENEIEAQAFANGKKARSTSRSRTGRPSPSSRRRKRRRAAEMGLPCPSSSSSAPSRRTARSIA